MNIVVITLKDGKVDITKEELEKMQNDAYDKGYRKAKNEVTVSYPTFPYTTTIKEVNLNPELNSPKITC